MRPAESRIYAFDAYRFNAATGELRRNNYSIRLAEQTSRLLGHLIEHAETVVTREELRPVLWPDGEHVDYDHCISNCISQLRTVFRDNVRSPRYVATVSKRGYRFVAPVSLVPCPSEQWAGPRGDTGIHRSIGSAASEDQSESQQTSPASPVLQPDSAARTDLLKKDSEPGTRWSPVQPSRLATRRKGWIAIGIFVIILLSVLGFYATTVRHSAPAPDIYLGVAPFETQSDDGQLSESFRLELADAISVLPGVQVSAAHSFPSGKLDDNGIRKLASDLHLDVVVLGKFTQNGRNCDLQFELVRAKDAVHLGSFSYTGTIDDLSSIRDRAQNEIFARLDLVRYATKPPQPSKVDARAYETYLRARYHFSQQTDDSLKQALEEFKAAASIDPQFAKAFAGQADTYLAMAEHDLIDPEEGYGKARDLARKVIQMDDSLADGHALLGLVTLAKDWDLVTAETELRKAVRLDPNSARYHDFLAFLLCIEGRFDESFREIDLAHAVDPFWPPIYVAESYVASAAHDYSRMIDAGEKLLKLRPDWNMAHHQMGWVFWYAGRYEDAIREWQRMAEIENDRPRMELEKRGMAAFRQGGRAAYARLRLDAIRRGNQWAHAFHDFDIAEWSLYAGDQDATIAALKAIVAQHDPAAMEIAVDPVYEDLHQDARFQQLVDSVFGASAAKQIQARVDARHAAAHQ